MKFCTYESILKLSIIYQFWKKYKGKGNSRQSERPFVFDLFSDLGRDHSRVNLDKGTCFKWDWDFRKSGRDHSHVNFCKTKGRSLWRELPLLDAQYLADLEQLQNRYFAFSNRSKPIWVLTRTKSLYMLDRLPICYHLPDFQLIWSNFKIEFSQLQTALNPYEFWRACFYPTSDDHLPMGYSLPDFQPNRSNFLAALPLFTTW